MILGINGIIAGKGINQVIPPLDIYNATAAYSFRKLRSTYTGYCVRVRRASDNVSQDFGFNSNGDIDTIAMMSFLNTSSGYVSIWYDQSGNSRNLESNASFSQCRIANGTTLATLGGKVAMQAYSGYQVYDLNWGISLNNPQLYHVSSIDTFFGAYNYSGHWIVFGNHNQFNTNHFTSANNDGTYVDMFSNNRYNFPNFSASLGVRYLEVYQNISSTTTRYINGSNKGSISSYSIVTPSNLLLGGDSSTSPARGYIQELIIYADGTTPVRETLETNINQYYSIY